MKLGPVDNCRWCNDRIMICPVRGGTWLPFDFHMIEAASDAPDAYVPIRVGKVMALVAIGDAPPRSLDGVRWYAQRHRCAPFLRHVAAKREERAAKRENVDSLAAALAAYFAPEEKAQ